MAFDIYGGILRPGFCKVHPDVHEEYPCSLCIAEWEEKQERERDRQRDETDPSERFAN